MADDGAFPELQGYFPLRDSGTLYAHFAFLMADPGEKLNIALAGPEWFTLRKDGIAFWLQTRGGALYHYSDSIPKRLVALRAFSWYLVDAAYDVAAGTYDLAIREEGRTEPLISLKGQPNAFSQPGSAVNKFSFIGDNGHDTSNVDYWVDDVLLTVDQPIPIAPFVAPGRRKLFFDTWKDAQRLLRSRPLCLPAIDLEDFGLTREAIDDLRRAGLLPLLESLVDGPRSTAAIHAAKIPATASLEAGRTLEAIRLWSEGCASLGRNDAKTAFPRFEEAIRQAPSGRIFELSAVLSLAALGRWPEVDARLAGLYGAWRDDPRLPLALAMIGLARDDLDAAEQPLRPRAGAVPDDPRLECALVALSGRLDRGLVEMVKGRFPEQWQTCLDAALLPEEYYFVLLFRKSDAGRYATRMAEQLKGLHLPSADWVERIGDAAFLANDYPEALRRYEESAGEAGLHPGLMLKLSDVHFLLGDVDKERLYREAIYGSLREEKDP